ncbi:MAG: hypothetical protein IJE88_06490 [Akkermansia sp.]|nr:hypothetical protein [Akkermansia sp.]
MGRILSLLLLVFCLNSCVYVNTHRACADRGRQCQAVILPDQENLVIYNHHGRLYLQGVLTTVRRTGRDKVSSFKANDFSSGQYVPIKGAPQCYVYRQIGEADIIEDDVFNLIPGKGVPEDARVVGHRRQPTGYQIDSLNCNPVTTHLQYGWQTELPKYARRYYRNMVTSEHQNVGSHLCNTRNGFIIPVTPSRTNKHAWYAYPLAGASFVLIDVPGTLLANTVVPVAYGIAAIPCSIYEKGKRIFVKPTK